MHKLLTIQSSLFGHDGQSSRLIRRFTDQWLRQHPEGSVITRDLAASPVPHLDAARLAALMTPEAERTPVQQAVVDFSDALIDEIREADVLALGVPMYNFDVPSTLRAYFDHIARAGVTFRYTADGPKGLIDDKPTYVFLTRGGIHGEDHPQTRYLQQFLGLIGISNVEFVHAEGLNMETHRERALERAHHRITRLAPALASSF